MNQSTDYRITGYEPAFYDKMLDLQRLLWGADRERNAAYFDWKYRQNPYLDHRYVTLGWAGGKLVGMLAAFGACWQIDSDRSTLIPCLADAVITPPHRGGSLFGQLINNLIDRLRADGISHLLDFGNGAAAPSLVLRGWRRIGPWAIVQTKPCRDHGCRPSWSCASFPTPGRQSGAVIIQCDEINPDSMVALVRRVQPPIAACSHVFDSQYLSWWHANPMSHYFCLTAEKDGFVGYLIAQRPADPHEINRETTILDCFSGDDAVWSDLMETAAATLPGPRIVMWARDIPSYRRDSLHHLGYAIRHPTGHVTHDWELPDLLVMTLDGGNADRTGPSLSNPETWNLRAVCGRSWR